MPVAEGGLPRRVTAPAAQHGQRPWLRPLRRRRCEREDRDERGIPAAPQVVLRLGDPQPPLRHHPRRSHVRDHRLFHPRLVLVRSATSIASSIASAMARATAASCACAAASASSTPPPFKVCGGCLRLPLATIPPPKGPKGPKGPKACGPRSADTCPPDRTRPPCSAATIPTCRLPPATTSTSPVT